MVLLQNHITKKLVEVVGTNQFAIIDRGVIIREWTGKEEIDLDKIIVTPETFAKMKRS